MLRDPTAVCLRLALAKQTDALFLALPLQPLYIRFFMKNYLFRSSSHLEGHISGDQGLFLILCSFILPGCAQGPVCGAED